MDPGAQGWMVVFFLAQGSLISADTFLVQVELNRWAYLGFWALAVEHPDPIFCEIQKRITEQPRTGPETTNQGHPPEEKADGSLSPGLAGGVCLWLKDLQFLPTLSWF